ncbi:MAG: FmdE family protein, partial [Desulfovermiculus sp.]
MNISQALKRIDDESIQVLRRSVRVDFDHCRKKPKAFYINHQIHEIVSAIGPFAGDLAENDSLYIVHTGDQLTYVLHGIGREHCAGQKGEEPYSWTLDARILRDEELMSFFREEQCMLVNMDLKRIADFHGHLCPDLVIGTRAVETALDFLQSKEELQSNLCVVAHNQTSALDAIQYLTGCTLGNQRLMVNDWGKHRYQFISGATGRAVDVRMRPVHFHLEGAYFELEEKVQRQGGTMYEVARMQGMISQWVQWLTSISAETLFTVEETACELPAVEVCSRYVQCIQCGDLVQKRKAVRLREGLFCVSCAQSTVPDTAHL